LRVFINDEIFHCNLSFASCLSQAIFHQKLTDSTLHEIYFNNTSLHSILLSFFYLLKGYPFSFSSYNINDIQSVIDLIGLTSLSTNIPVPSTFNEAISFLSIPICADNNIHFEQACDLIAQYFTKITSQDFLRLTDKSLERILSSEHLCLPSEDFLFKTILENPQKMHLLKFVVLPAVNYQLLKSFIDKLPFSEINFDFFENIKSLIFFPQENFFINRWEKPPTFLSLEQFHEFVNVLYSFSNQFKNPQENLEQVINYYQKYENEFNSLKVQLNKEIEERHKKSETIRELETQLEQSQIKTEELKNYPLRLNSISSHISLKLKSPLGKTILFMKTNESEDDLHQILQKYQVNFNSAQNVISEFKQFQSELIIDLFNNSQKIQTFQVISKRCNMNCTQQINKK
jgi:hypothetical protein